MFTPHNDSHPLFASSFLLQSIKITLPPLQKPPYSVKLLVQGMDIFTDFMAKFQSLPHQSAATCTPLSPVAARAFSLKGGGGIATNSDDIQ